MANGCCDTQVTQQVRRPVHTVGSYLDQQIENSRKNTEQLCILKAKAEASGILNYPHEDLQAIVMGYTFL